MASRWPRVLEARHLDRAEGVTEPDNPLRDGTRAIPDSDAGADLVGEVVALRAENARLRQLLGLDGSAPESAGQGWSPMLFFGADRGRARASGSLARKATSSVSRRSRHSSRTPIVQASRSMERRAVRVLPRFSWSR